MSFDSEINYLFTSSNNNDLSSYTEDKELSKFADSTIVDDPQLDPRIPFREG